jgi:hypothetical protein
MKATATINAITAIASEWGIDIVKIGSRYGYYADETSSWWYVSTADIANAKSYFSEEYMPYSQWCAGCLSSREISLRTVKKYRLA